MLSKVKWFFETYVVSVKEAEQDKEYQLRLAAAALLVEMVAQDQQVHEQERVAVRQALQAHLDLSAEQVEHLYGLAEDEKQLATDYHQFTRLIAEHYPQDKKVHLIELLWRVAYADGELNRYEEQMVRKICDLIHVSHKDYLQARHRVEALLGAG